MSHICLICHRSPEEQGMDIVAHVGAVRLQDLYQGGGGGQAQGLGGPRVRHAETQAQAAHGDTHSLHSTEALPSPKLNFCFCSSFRLLSDVKCQMSNQNVCSRKHILLKYLATAQKATAAVLNFGIVVFTQKHNCNGSLQIFI